MSLLGELSFRSVVNGSEDEFLLREKSCKGFDLVSCRSFSQNSLFGTDFDLCLTVLYLGDPSFILLSIPFSVSLVIQWFQSINWSVMIPRGRYMTNLHQNF